MTNGAECRIIEYGSEEYRAALLLRDDVLRKPLGLSIYDDPLELEGDYLHVGLFAAGKLAAYGTVEVLLHARMTAAGFYDKLGYARDGEVFYEVSLEHVKMYKKLVEQARNSLHN